MMFKEIENKLQDFDPIGLDEMGSVRLMSRIDTKYVSTFKTNIYFGRIKGQVFCI